MTILKTMFIIALGTYVAYELTIRNKNLLSGPNTKQLKLGVDDKPVFDL